MDISEYFEYWRGRIERDLIPFADPGTQLDLAGERRQIAARWTSRGRSLDAVFSVSLEGGVQASFKGQSLSYKSFLSGPDLADLLGLAKMTLQTRPPGLFVPTKARLADDPTGEPAPAVELLRSVLRDEPADATRIVMVTGEAGAGKTSVLQELVKQQALDYQHGRSDRLYVYINAQGRALARFNEALATELQDLRATLTYHAVSTLVRLGVLIPVIDGFDELLGVGGYDDAFSSLTGFIEELDGHGQILASARSSYYEQEFVARASSVSALGAQAWSQVPIEVLAWTDEEFDAYVRMYSESEQLPADESSAMAERVRAIFSGRNAGLRNKPLFVSRTVAILRKEPGFQGGDDLLRELVSAYLDRERKEKLLDRHGGSLLSARQMELLFTTLAEEMWNQETRELDRRSIREVAEFVLVTEGVDEASQRVVMERMPQLAFLAPGERSGGVAFEHEMFLSFFLAQVFQERLLQDGTAVRVFLSRSVLPTEVAVTTIGAIDRLLPVAEPATSQLIFDRLGEASSVETPRAPQVRENAGVVVQALLKAAATHGSIKGVRIWRVVLPGGDLNGVELSGATLERVEFRRVDLSNTRFIRCSAEAVLFGDIIVDPARTRLELAGIDVLSQIVGLRVRELGLAKGIYDPLQIQKVLVACGALPQPPLDQPTSVRDVPAAYRDLLEKLARAYRRANPVCTADNNLKHLFKDRDWPTLEQLLLSHGIVTRETKQTGGPQKVFLRRQVLPEQLMAGADRTASVPPAVRSFWEELEARVTRD